jgi:hypothetical protein
MRAFKVSLNGKKLCLAGVGEHGVLSAIVNWVAGDRGADLFMEVGGLASEEHVAWIRQKHLRVGDEIRVKIVDAGSVDRPVEKRRVHPAETIRAQKHHVRMMAKKLGWKIRGQSPRSTSSPWVASEIDSITMPAPRPK